MSRPHVEAPDSGATGQAQGYSTTDTAIVGDDTAHSKRFATLQALLAIRGFQLIALSCGGFLICRWDRSAHAPDLRGVEAFYERVSGGTLP